MRRAGAARAASSRGRARGARRQPSHRWMEAEPDDRAISLDRNQSLYLCTTRFPSGTIAWGLKTFLEQHQPENHTNHLCGRGQVSQ